MLKAAMKQGGWHRVAVALLDTNDQQIGWYELYSIPTDNLWHSFTYTLPATLGAINADLNPKTHHLLAVEPDLILGDDRWIRNNIVHPIGARRAGKPEKIDLNGRRAS